MAQALSVAGPQPQALADLYPRIFRYVLSVVRDRAEAEDLTQETFLRAHRRRDSLRAPEATASWLYSIATHACLERLRERARRAPDEAWLDPQSVSPPDPAPPPGLRLEQDE